MQLPKRYIEFFEGIENDNPFMGVRAKCYEDYKQANEFNTTDHNKSKKNVKSFQDTNDNNSIDTNFKIKRVINECMEKENDTVFKHLSVYDKFVVGNLLISMDGNVSKELLLEGFADYNFLQLFCLNGPIICDAYVIDRKLSDLASQMTFLLERCFLL